jgi:DNA polymerase I-like protein with 3'-5' exonuclease and polymerase domains
MFDSIYGIPVLATFHPAFFLHSRGKAVREQKGKSPMGAVHSLIFDIAEKPKIPRVDPRDHVLLFPSPKALATALAEYDPSWLAIDIETSRSLGKSEADVHVIDGLSSRIVRASVGGRGYRALSFPWTEPFIAALRSKLDRFKQFVFWNYRFDVPRLNAQGLPIPPDRVVDAMWLFHFLYPHLPYGLSNAATYYTGLPEWKSMSTAQPEYYSAMDSLATSMIYEGILRELDDTGTHAIADRHVTMLLRVLDRMSARGVRIDADELQAFQLHLEEQVTPLEAQLVDLEPPEIRRFSPPEGYKVAPRDRQIRVSCTNCQGRGSQVKTYKNGRERAVKCKICKGHGETATLDTAGLTQLPNERWALRKPWSANSPQKLLEYIRLRDHRMTQSGRRPDDTENSTISRLAIRYPNDRVYPLVQKIRSLRKLSGTYANWPIGADGRIHTEFTLKPETQRLSSARPNVQNVPQPDDDDPNNLRLRFRKCLVASKGNCLGSIDYEGIEAVLTGWFAGDDDYIELAKKGVHAYATAKFLGEDVSPETFTHEDKLRIARTHPKIYKQLKSANHGINYGEGVIKLYRLNLALFRSVDEARQMWEFIRSLIPKVIEWQDRITALAFKENRITNPFHYPRWFWDRGTERNEVLAQLPQSTAAAIIKEAMLRIDTSEIGRFMVWQIHDELVFDAPAKRIRSVMLRARQLMELPTPELGGLVIRTSGKIGPNLGELEAMW